MSREIKFKMWLPHAKRMAYAMSLKDIITNTCYDDGVVYLQYTGLKDKNGKEIYDGDILDYTEWRHNTDNVAFNTRYRVEWQQLKWVLIHVSERYSVQLWQQLKPEVIQNLNNDGCKAREFEVIGNIYDPTPSLTD